MTAYLNAQIEAGAQTVMIFDSWGGALSAAAYREFSLNYMQRILDGLVREKDGERIPVIVFTKGAGYGWRRLPEAAVTPSAWTGPLNWAKRVAVSAHKSPCRAIWTRASCSLRRK